MGSTVPLHRHSNVVGGCRLSYCCSYDLGNRWDGPSAAAVKAAVVMKFHDDPSIQNLNRGMERKQLQADWCHVLKL